MPTGSAEVLESYLRHSPASAPRRRRRPTNRRMPTEVMVLDHAEGDGRQPVRAMAIRADLASNASRRDPLRDSDRLAIRTRCSGCAFVSRDRAVRCPRPFDPHGSGSARTSSSGGDTWRRAGCAGFRADGLPSMKRASTGVVGWRMWPAVTTRLARLPASSDPTWSATPRICAGVERHRLECRILGKAEGDGGRRLVGEVPAAVAAAGPSAPASGSRRSPPRRAASPGWRRPSRTGRARSPGRSACRRRSTGTSGLLERCGDFPRLGRPRDHRLELQLLGDAPGRRGSRSGDRRGRSPASRPVA